MSADGTLRVLLIEDNELDARAMTRSLTHHPEIKFEITRAADLATAEQLLDSADFDCALLDLSLPDSSGLVSVQVLSARAPDCPIVVLTGLDDPSTALEAVEQGAQDYLSKNSADPDTVARSVRYAVARHHGDMALRSATDQLGLLRDRERIARDLHDTVIQQLFATGLGLQSVAGSINDPEALDRVEAAIEGIDAAIRQMREAIFGLHSIPDSMAIGQTITALAREKAQSLGFNPIVEIGPMPEDLSVALGHEATQVIGEALSNVARHAEATAATVSLSVDNGWLVAVITDNGTGGKHLLPGGDGSAANHRDPRDTGQTVDHAPRRSPSGFGLANMSERAENLNGYFHIGPGAGGGTRVEWRVPLS